MAGNLSEKLKQYRLNQTEYEMICKLLGREPRGVEWALFSALWSEHCSYKSSKVHLRKFAMKSEHVLNIEGENAGIVDLGKGEKVAFKMESHNHPSFIEPFQGAATGVGGILRDIFTMGARPIMIADYLCFGEENAERMKYLMNGVVKGISSYGNCVGVPTCTGRTNYLSEYNQNILVNAMAVGLFTSENPIILSKASGVGNIIVYVGAKTGKDGIHGASMASESFDNDNESKKPNVQIGDPFYEKLLIEACLEVIKENLVVAMQDMGAAGLISSSFEMSAKGEVGFDIDLTKVPTRDSTMTPEEILLSESQERMLLICEPSKLNQIKSVFDKWDLDANEIGKVVNGHDVTLRWKGEVLTKIDPKLLVDHAPRYERKYKAWLPKYAGSRDELFQESDEYLNQINLKSNSSGTCGSKASEDKSSNSFDKKELTGQILRNHLSKLLNSTGHSSPSWIYEQYDQRVGLRTMKDASFSVAVQKLPSNRLLSVSLGCRPEIMRLDAQLGAIDAVFYPALKMACKGFTPLAITDCLNFGNPENESIMSEFVASVEAIAESAKELRAPVISGNVSFYNESNGKNIISTPAVGIVGLSTLSKVPEDQFQNSGDQVFKISIKQAEFVSETSRSYLGKIDIKKLAEFTRKIQSLVIELNPTATKVVGLGGLAETLFSMSNANLGLKGLNDFNIQSSELKFLIDDSQAFEKKSEFTYEFMSKFIHNHLYEVIMSFKAESDIQDQGFNNNNGSSNENQILKSIQKIMNQENVEIHHLGSVEKPSRSNNLKSLRRRVNI